MAIKRQKLDRKVNLTSDGGRVVDMPPGWSYTINCPHHGKISFDFTPYRIHGREDLASHIRDAFWSLRHEVSGKTLKTYMESGLRPFWRFLDNLYYLGEPITRLNQIDRTLIDRYLAWLELQLVTKDGRKNIGEKWSVGTKRRAFTDLKAILTNRQKRTPDAVDAGLTFPRNPFPNSQQQIQKREPYSAGEQKQIIDALNKDLRTIHEGNGEPLTDLQLLVVHLLILGLATGRNLQSLLDLRRDSLHDHPLPDRKLLLTFKRRGWSTHATSIIRVAPPADYKTIQAIPSNIGEHFHFLCRFTAPLMGDVSADERNFVFLRRMIRDRRKGQVIRLSAEAAKSASDFFARRHNLKDDHGRDLAFNLSRCRPTMATELYRRTGDIRRVQQALGHASVQTTARHYANLPLESERNHAFALDDMVCQFTKMEIAGKVLLAADGQIPLSEIKDLLSGGYNTGIARCRNPFRENNSICKKYFICFRCPNMCVFEDDLWRLFSFYYRLLAERTKLNPSHWSKTYGPIIRRIDYDIASKFPVEKVKAARLKAMATPHPTWKASAL